MCGSNYNSGIIQECYNIGTVSGTNWVGGVCGQNDRGTLENSYNIGTVSGIKVGGVCGENWNNGTVKGCYSKVSGRGVCCDNSGTVENCYYLSDTSGTAHSQGGTSKTEAEFQSGEVAFLLQKPLDDAATESAPAPQVWGQTLTGENSQPYPVLNGLKVYQGTPCQGRYSNAKDEELDHNYQNGVCIYCGQPQIAYTVTIPASVELGNTATIAATGVTLPNGKQLNVKVADGSEFKVTLGDDTRDYKVYKGETEVKSGNTVLTVGNGESEKTVELQFDKPKTTTYSGTYTGTVSFTVSVDDKS